MSVDWTPGKGPKTRRLAEARFHRLLYLQSMTDDDLFLETARREIPDAWRTLELDVDAEEPKQKVTLYLDRRVAQMFRRMGKGYQARINRILETWLQLKMSEKAVLRKETLEWVLQAMDEKNGAKMSERVKAEYERLVKDVAYEEGRLAGLRERGEG